MYDIEKITRIKKGLTFIAKAISYSALADLIKEFCTFLYMKQIPR
jgi:hypothetical protein